jgi:uncharacterized protein
VGGLAALGVACVAYGVLVERHWYVLRRARLDGALRHGGSLTILHLSDVHLQPGQQRRVAFLESLADEPYDLVVATGDLLGAQGVEDETVDALAALTADGRPGLVVLGSNDLYGPVLKSPLSYFTAPRRRAQGPRLDTDRLVAGLAETGWTTLRNSATVLDTAAGPVAAGGIDDPHLHTSHLPTAAEVAPPVEDAIAHLGLVHAPYTDALDVLVEAGHDLLLAGHTHGGQVRLPGVGALVANCDLPLDQTRGVSRYRGRWLNVSAGLGHSRYAPFRFACRPEASLLTLTG